MTESTAKAPAGWYPDPRSDGERYWDGAAWTTQTRPAPAKEVSPSPAPSTATEKPEGVFRRMARNAKQAMDEAAAERAETERQLREAYGETLEKVSVGFSSVEIRSGGYVRVGGSGRALDAFEKLRGISFSHSKTQMDKSAGGRALGAAATMGLSRLNSNEKVVQTSHLMITTDKKVHRLGGVAISDGLALEAAGNAVLDLQRHEASSIVAAPQQSPAEQLREIAALHRDGILSDEEFAAAKAKFLDQI